MSLQIAVDGPVAAGKGSVARLVAQRLKMLYIDTGAMYRMVALLAKRHNIELSSESELTELIKQTKMEMRNPTEDELDGRLITVLMDGEDVSWAIRTEEVGVDAAKVAALAKVRATLVEKQQLIAANQDVVMEGRDITYKVLPNAQLKIFLTASPETRAKRRLLGLQSRGHDVTFEQVYQDLLDRDKLDTERAADPLKVVEGAWVLDTSNLNIDEVVELITERAKHLK